MGTPATWHWGTVAIRVIASHRAPLPPRTNIVMETGIKTPPEAVCITDNANLIVGRYGCLGLSMLLMPKFEMLFFIIN